MRRLLLSEDVPLRTTRMLGDYAEDAPLGRVYGDLTASRFKLLRLADDRFFCADHPMEMTGLYVGKEATKGYQQALESDSLGNTWTEVRTAAPVPVGVEVSGVGRGFRDPTTGLLLQNPADIVADLMRICGRAEDWSALRAETSRAGIVVARHVGTVQSLRAQVDEILQSVAVIWTPGMARMYPTSAEPVPIFDLEPGEVSDFEVTATAADTADILRIAYDVCDATGMAQASIELTASPARYGGLVKEVTYAWLRTPVNAEAVGRAVLSRLAGERYAVKCNSTRKMLRAGMWVRPLAHPEWPLDGDPVSMVLGAEIDQSTNSVRLTGETVLSVPTITVTAHSIALPDTSSGFLEVAERNGVATFTVFDQDRKALTGARISLDGGQPKTTDGRGQVAFAYTPGEHELALEAPGKVSQVLTVTL